MNKTRMRIAPASAKLEWRTIAVTAKDPLAFAKDLQSALQELTDDGFTIASQMPRGEGLIITGSRLEAPVPSEPSELPKHTTRRRVIELPSARLQSTTSEEVLYHFIENGQQRQLPFPTLVAALRTVQLHLSGASDVLPVGITTVALTRFEPTAFPMLLKMFAEEMRCLPG